MGGCASIPNPQGVAPASGRNQHHTNVATRGNPPQRGRHPNIEATPDDSKSLFSMYLKTKNVQK
jgi:hypothetical protein